MDKFLGKRLDGRYEIQEILGVGGMAVVYKAYDNVDDRMVAIKILKEEFTGNDEFIRRFKNESKAIAVLSHPNIVKVTDVSFGDLIQYIVMEYIEGITLKEYIEQSGPLSWNEAVHFTLQILRGLQHAHDKGVVHRDIKPQNIMLLADKTIKVTDFGIARFARSEQRTITDKAIGSVHYISPEQARGEKTDEKADVYSIGVMLYEMLTGRLPFQAESAVSVAIMQLQQDPTLPRDINGSIPLGLEQITMHAMQKDTSKRYKSAAEMLCDLEAFKKNPAITFDYDYFVDDSPTKFIPTADATAEKEESDGKKFPIIPILAGVSTAFVVAMIILLVVVLNNFFGKGGKEIELPSFVGEKYEDIINNEEYKDLFVFVREDGEYSAEYEVGEISKQSPEAGKSVRPGQKVVLTVSQGEKTVTVPNIYGYTRTRAKTVLDSYEFEYKFVEEPSEDIDLDCVIKTDPYVGTPVTDGTIITVYISTGPQVEYVELPDLINVSKNSVSDVLESSGLKLGVVTEDYSDTVRKGFVCAMSPDPTSTKQVVKGSSVDVIISKGPAPSVSFALDLPAYMENETPVSRVAVSLWDGSNKIYDAPFDVYFDDSGDVSFDFSNVRIDTLPKTLIVKYNINGTDVEIMTIKVENASGKVSVTKPYNPES